MATAGAGVVIAPWFEADSIYTRAWQFGLFVWLGFLVRKHTKPLFICPKLARYLFGFWIGCVLLVLLRADVVLFPPPYALHFDQIPAQVKNGIAFAAVVICASMSSFIDRSISRRFQVKPLFVRAAIYIGTIMVIVCPIQRLINNLFAFDGERGPLWQLLGMAGVIVFLSFIHRLGWLRLVSKTNCAPIMISMYGCLIAVVASKAVEIPNWLMLFYLFTFSIAMTMQVALYIASFVVLVVAPEDPELDAGPLKLKLTPAAKAFFSNWRNAISSRNLAVTYCCGMSLCVVLLALNSEQILFGRFTALPPGRSLFNNALLQQLNGGFLSHTTAPSSSSSSSSSGGKELSTDLKVLTLKPDRSLTIETTSAGSGTKSTIEGQFFPLEYGSVVVGNAVVSGFLWKAKDASSWKKCVGQQWQGHYSMGMETNDGIDILFDSSDPKQIEQARDRMFIPAFKTLTTNSSANSSASVNSFTLNFLDWPDMSVQSQASGSVACVGHLSTHGEDLILRITYTRAGTNQVCNYRIRRTHPIVLERIGEDDFFPTELEETMQPGKLLR